MPKWSVIGGSACPGCIGSVFWVRFSACTWLFSSTHSTTAFSGGARYSPTMSTTLASSSGSVENLNVSAFHGLTPYSFQIAATVECSIPSRSANSRLDQCVTPRLFGGGVNVAVITFARSTLRGRPGGRTPSRPASPCSA